MLSALFLSLIALPAQAPVQEIQSERVTCTTCSGEGTVVLPCRVCEGRGSASCPKCTWHYVGDNYERHLAILRVTDPTEARKEEEALKSLKASSKKMEMDFGIGFGVEHRGTVNCPNCINGAHLIFKESLCKICKGKGRLKCRTCKGQGRAKCHHCGGRKKLRIACPECSGRKTSADPLLRTQDAIKCPWCEGEVMRDCTAFGEDEEIQGWCKACGGDGKGYCRSCAGYKKVACQKCSGLGELKAVFGQKPGPCDECRSKGVLPCKKCKSGVARCEYCAGKGKAPLGCGACLGLKKAPCAGCWQRSERAWVVTAERLSAAGKKKEALAHMEVALGRVHMRERERLAAVAGDNRQTKAVEKEFKKLIQELEGRQAEMETGIPDQRGG